MDLIEAQDLSELVWYESGAHVEVRQIGNGEWVVYRNYSQYIWSKEDWERVKREA